MRTSLSCTSSKRVKTPFGGEDGDETDKSLCGTSKDLSFCFIAKFSNISHHLPSQKQSTSANTPPNVYYSSANWVLLVLRRSETVILNIKVRFDIPCRHVSCGSSLLPLSKTSNSSTRFEIFFTSLHTFSLYYSMFKSSF